MDFELFQKQQDYWNALFKPGTTLISDNQYKEYANFGGFGSGKSLIQYLATYVISATYSDLHGITVRDTYPELTDSVIPQFHELFKYNGYKYNKSERVIYFNNGSRLDFRAFDTDTKILSSQYNFVAISQAEQISYDMFLQLLGRNRRRNNPNFKKNLMLIEGNPGSGWCKKRYIDNRLQENVFFMQTKTYDNPFLPKDYIDNMMNNYPESWIKRYIHGEWENFDEMVFSDFMVSVNKVDAFYPGEYYKNAIGIDYGFVNPTAILWAAIDYDDRIFIWDEFYEAGKKSDEIALEALKHGVLAGPIDPSSKAPDRDGKSVFTDLLAFGVPVIEANKHKMRNIITVNRKFKHKQLFITKNCVNLIEEIKNYKWKRLKIGKVANSPEEVVKKDDHACDALMYLVAYIEDLKSHDPDKKDIKQTIYHKTRAKDRLKINDLG